MELSSVSASRSRHLRRLILLIGVALSSAVYLQNLGNPSLTLWDEAIQVNVVQNLAEHCCLPNLHRSAIVESLGGAPGADGISTKGFQLRHVRPGTDYRDWSNSTRWLHKPLLPFYVAAATFKLSGGTLWGLRLSGVLFALLNAAIIYRIGREHLSSTVGLCGMGLFALNPYTNQLVHGQRFVGFPDLALSSSISRAMYFVLRWTRFRSKAALRWLGVAVGVGYLCKGGLALGPIAILAAVTILSGAYRDLLVLLQPIGISAGLVLAEQSYWRLHDPVLLRYESHDQLMHLFQNIEGWGAPWWKYVVGYAPAMLTLPLIPIAYFSVLWAVSKFKPSATEFVLGLWILTYVVTLSFGVSKIENLIFPSLPAFALLIPRALEDLIRRRRSDLVLAFCVATLAIMFLSEAWGNLKHPGRVALLSASAVILLSIVRMSPPWKSRTETLTLACAAFTAAVVLLLYLREDIHNNALEPEDFKAQATLRQTGIALRPLVDKNGLILVHSQATKLSYLYLMYWSSVDVLDLCREPNPSSTTAILRPAQRLYLLTERSMRGTPLANLPLGNLYDLSNVPYEDWSKAATAGCTTQ